MERLIPIAFVALLAGCGGGISDSEFMGLVQKVDRIESKIDRIEGEISLLADPDTRYLIRQISSLSERRAELLTRCEPDDPRLAAIDAQIAELEKKLRPHRSQ